MSDKRKALIYRNKQFVTIPSPDLDSMTDEQLELRANVLEGTFRRAFDEENDELGEEV